MLLIDGNFPLNARGVGFLQYFQIKQLPNFLLASPILSLAVFSIVQYAKSEPEKFISLGFRASAEDKNSAAVFFSLEASLRSNKSHVKENSSHKVKGTTFKQKLASSATVLFGILCLYDTIPESLMMADLLVKLYFGYIYPYLLACRPYEVSPGLSYTAYLCSQSQFP